jgi:hypothetical protein
MKRYKTAILSITFLFFLTINCKAQALITYQIGKIVYKSSSIDKDSSIKKSYAILCSKYVREHYRHKNLPLIFLVQGQQGIEVSYDNLKGNSLTNKLYYRKSQYDLPGIRLKFNFKRMPIADVLRLLEFATNNLSKLKKIRHDALKLDYYDQPNTLSLSTRIIDSILNSETSKQQ